MADDDRGGRKGRQLVHQTDRWVNDAVGEAVRAGAVQAAMGDVARRVGSARLITPVGELEAARAASYLDAVHGKLISKVSNEISPTYSTYRWLWYLRRLDDQPLFSQPNIPGADVYNRALASTVATLRSPRDWGRIDPDLERTGVGFPVDTEVGGNLVRLVMFATAIDEVHTAHRMVSKGARLRIKADGFWDVLAEPELREAVTLYDRRSAARGWGGLTDLGSTASVDPSDGPYLVMGYTLKPYELPVSLFQTASDDLGVGADDYFETRHTLSISRLSEAAPYLSEEYISDASAWDASAPLLFTLSTFMVPRLADRNRDRFNLFNYGYCLQPEAGFTSYFDEHRAEIVELISKILPQFADEVPSDGAAFVAALKDLRGRAHPFVPGPVVFDTGLDYLGIDMASVSWRLSQVFPFPTRGDGTIGNARGDAFEAGTRAMIERVGARPPTPLAALSGRTLRRDGSSLSDVDAIAMKDDRLLLVSCKARLATPEYSAGVHSEVRRTTEALERAVAEWRSLMAELSARPVGDNYDLSGYDLAGVVVTPEPLFVPLAIATSEVAPGLREFSSVRELEHWLM